MQTAVTQEEQRRRLSELETMKASLELQLKEMARKVKIQQEQIELAKLDALTGLRSRSGVSDEVSNILKERQQGVFFIIDMDNFKAVNDTYGHLEGDRVLVKFSQALEKVTEKDDLIARIGGDEFIIFTPHELEKNELRRKASRILRMVTAEIVEPGKLVRITMSMGVSVAPNDGMTFDKLYENADKALYEVKNGGKGAFRLYNETATDTTKKNKKQTATLREITVRLKEKGMEGSFVVEYDSFENIYRFLERNIGREKREVQCVLFTIEEPTEADYDERELQRQMEHLQHAIIRVLRRGDVTTNYSANQILVLLLDTNTENSKFVVRRILNQFYAEMDNDFWQITNEIQQLVPEERA